MQILEPTSSARFDFHTADFLKRTGLALAGALVALGLVLAVAVAKDPTLGQEPAAYSDPLLVRDSGHPPLPSTLKV